MGRGWNETLFGMELDALSVMFIVFFVLWVLWGMIQYGLKKLPEDRSEDSDKDQRSTP